jgi:hypothetical protein
MEADQARGGLAELSADLTMAASEPKRREDAHDR